MVIDLLGYHRAPTVGATCDYDIFNRTASAKNKAKKHPNVDRGEVGKLRKIGVNEDTKGCDCD
jgi:hypothetical protein